MFVVEDNRVLGGSVVSALQENGFRVEGRAAGNKLVLEVFDSVLAEDILHELMLEVAVRLDHAMQGQMVFINHESQIFAAYQYKTGQLVLHLPRVSDALVAYVEAQNDTGYHEDQDCRDIFSHILAVFNA